MRNVRLLRMFGYGASLALAVALAAPGVPNDIGGSHTAFAQGTGQPAPGQPAPGQPGTGDQSGGQTPNTSPGVPTETTSGPNQSGADQQGTGTQQQGTGTGTGTGAGTGAGSQQQGTGAGTGTGTGTTTQQGTGMGTSTQQQGATRDPMRGGVEVPGQPACYMPALNVTERRPYNMSRPACFGQLQ